MKRFYSLVLAVAFAVLLPSCAVLEGMTSPLHKPQTEEQVQQESPFDKAMRLAHATIDEGNAALYGVNKSITSNVKNKIWTFEQGQEYLDISKGYGKQLTDARKALSAATLLEDVTDAQTQAEAIRSLIVTLHQRVAAAAQKKSALPEPLYI